jgi:2-oxoglutarate ferredoxin oxidoreductase subunit alpha
MIFFGTTTYAALEARDLLEEQGVSLDIMRVKAFPFSDAVKEFIDTHERIFVVEQNRDAQFKSLLVNELEINSEDLFSVLNYDGFPITAELIRQKIHKNLVGKLPPPFVPEKIGPPSTAQVEE